MTEKFPLTEKYLTMMPPEQKCIVTAEGEGSSRSSSGGGGDPEGDEDPEENEKKISGDKENLCPGGPTLSAT